MERSHWNLLQFKVMSWKIFSNKDCWFFSDDKGETPDLFRSRFSKVSKVVAAKYFSCVFYLLKRPALAPTFYSLIPFSPKPSLYPPSPILLFPPFIVFFSFYFHPCRRAPLTERPGTQTHVTSAHGDPNCFYPACTSEGVSVGRPRFSFPACLQMPKFIVTPVCTSLTHHASHAVTIRDWRPSWRAHLHVPAHIVTRCSAPSQSRRMSFSPNRTINKQYNMTH